MAIREPFNAWTHGLGGLAAIVGLVYLVFQAEGTLATTAYTIYGVSLVLVFLASSVYHALPVSRQTRRMLRRLDHSAIYLVIAGTYTPVALLALPGGWGWTLFGIVWGFAAVGIVTKNVWLDQPSWVTAAVYLVMGWTAVVAIKPMLDVFSWAALTWVVVGGLAYTVGAVVYATEWPDPLPDRIGAHGLWHLFVLAGAGSHYIFIVGYVPNV